MADIFLGSNIFLAVLVAIFAGLVAFFSPCILPVVPGYLAYISASVGSDGSGKAKGVIGAKQNKQMFLGVMLFVLGFSIVFVLLLSFSGTIGSLLIEYERMISIFSGVLMIFMGLVFLGRINFMQRNFKLTFKPKAGLWSAPLIGVVFAIGWTPCLGPSLALITVLALDSNSAFKGAVLALFYSIGLGLPFIFAALGFSWFTKTTAWIRRRIRFINIVGGLVMIIIGILMISGLWTSYMYYIQGEVANYASFI